jgi:hypothetical protein
MRSELLALDMHRRAVVFNVLQATPAPLPPATPRRTGFGWVLVAAALVGFALGWLQEHVAGIPGVLP